MKRTLQTFLSLAVVAASLVSCAKETLKENGIPAGEKIQVAFGASIGEFAPAEATKASAQSVVRVTWDATDDKVYVYDGSACLGTLDVTPNEDNASQALLSGTITASGASPSKLSLLYVKGAATAPAITEGKISVDISSQSGTEVTDVPFVLYASIDYDEAKLKKENEFVSFKFATSVMTVNCTNLPTKAQYAKMNITKAEINGVSTACELTIDGDGVKAIAGATPGTITRKAGFEQSDSRCSFKIALAADPAESVARKICVYQGSKVSGAAFTSKTLAGGKSYNTVYQLSEYPDGNLCFTAEENGAKVIMTRSGWPESISLVYYCTSDEVPCWKEFSPYETEVTLAKVGDKVYFRNAKEAKDVTAFSDDSENYYSFTLTGEASVSGNIMSLIDKNIETTAIPCDYCFKGLFCSCEKLTSAADLLLPATELAENCYANMFEGCSSLTKAPELPATTVPICAYLDMFRNCTSLVTAPELPATELAENCYTSMFEGCSSLTEAPELPATTVPICAYLYMFRNCTNLVTAPELPATELAENCYEGMFSGTGLVTAPELPATELADGCYANMFEECSNLTEAPELPATELAENCYAFMFEGCSSLTKAPELPATELAFVCYASMFISCEKLNYIKVAFTDWNNGDSTPEWLDGVADEGTFECPDGLNTDEGKDNGYIPTNWTVRAGVLPGIFTVSDPDGTPNSGDEKKVYFSQGNLVATTYASDWRFAANQYDYLGEGGANKTIGESEGDVDLFGWSTASTAYGISTSTEDSDYSGVFVDWGKAYCTSKGIEEGTWRTLTKDEWEYLINKDGNENIRKGKYKCGVTVCEKEKCMVLAPDDFKGTIAASYDATTWAAAEAAGLVCLPPAGYRNGSNVNNVDLLGYYWSSTAVSGSSASNVVFAGGGVSIKDDNRHFGCSVRLVTQAF